MGGTFRLRASDARNLLQTYGMDHPEVWDGLLVIEQVWRNHGLEELRREARRNAQRQRR